MQFFRCCCFFLFSIFCLINFFFHTLDFSFRFRLFLLLLYSVIQFAHIIECMSLWFCFVFDFFICVFLFFNFFIHLSFRGNNVFFLSFSQFCDRLKWRWNEIIIIIITIISVVLLFFYYILFFLVEKKKFWKKIKMLIAESRNDDNEYVF